MNKFDYQEMSTTTHNNQRWYKCSEDTYYPSITTILGQSASEEKKASLENWRQSIGVLNAKKITKDAARRGTAVHLMIEQKLKGEEINVPDATPDDKLMFNGMRFGLKNIQEVYGLEVPLGSAVLGVAGRTDCVGVYNGKEAIIDFKTSGRLKNDADIHDYWLQCTFYALAHNEMYGTDILRGVIIMGVANGIPMIWEKDLHEFIEPLCQRIDKFYSEQ